MGCFRGKDQTKDLVSLSEDGVIWFNEKRNMLVPNVEAEKPFVKVSEEAKLSISVKNAFPGFKSIVNTS